MESLLRGRATLYFTFGLTLLVCCTSIGGLAIDALYQRETPAWAVQCRGQDLINLIVLLPTFVVSFVCMRRGMTPAFFIWLGALLYVVYTFLIYCFGIHFNRFFLVYCATLGVSVYATLTTITKVDLREIAGWPDDHGARRLASIYLFMVAVLFFLLWFKEIIPATLSGEASLSLQDSGLPSNPVHVLDLAMVLPGFVVISVLVRKNHPYGRMFAPPLLAFIALMAVTIGWLTIIMSPGNLLSNLVVVGAFALLAVFSILVFSGLVKKRPV